MTALITFGELDSLQALDLVGLSGILRGELVFQMPKFEPIPELLSWKGIKPPEPLWFSVYPGLLSAINSTYTCDPCSLPEGILTCFLNTTSFVPFFS